MGSEGAILTGKLGWVPGEGYCVVGRKDPDGAYAAPAAGHGRMARREEEPHPAVPLTLLLRCCGTRSEEEGECWARQHVCGPIASRPDAPSCFLYFLFANRESETDIHIYTLTVSYFQN